MLSSRRIFLFLIIIVEVLCSECAVIDNLAEDFLKGDRYVYVPEADGSVKLVDILEPLDEKILSLDVKKATTFYLLTRNNPDEPQIIQFGDNNSFRESNFEVGKTTILVSHGWLQSYKGMNELAIEFLNDDDVNVINIDWSPISQTGYITAKSKTSEIGTFVGDFVQWLTTFGVSYDEVHLAGLSLGAQMLGSAGRQTGGKVRKITGIDPAGPLWYADKNILQRTDAQYVEVIHTNSLFFGFRFPCGDVDIYVNGGALQPACQVFPIRNICSHAISGNYFIVSLRYPKHFVARKCSSYAEARTQMCAGDPYIVGTSNLTKSEEGIFRVDTGAAYPY